MNRKMAPPKNTGIPNPPYPYTGALRIDKNNFLPKVDILPYFCFQPAGLREHRVHGKTIFSLTRQLVQQELQERWGLWERLERARRER